MVDPLGPSILAAVFLIFSIFVYAINAALPSADESELRKKAEQGDSQSGRILRLLSRFDEGYGEIRMTYAVLLLAGYVSLWAFAGPRLAQWLNLPALALSLLAAFVYLILALTFTAIIPGGIASHAPQAALKIAAVPAELAILALSPVTRTACLIGSAFLAPFHMRPGAASEHVSEEEILAMVDIGEEKGAIEADEKEMIENIFEFNNMSAEECMIHRKDITAIDAESTEEEVMTIITESGRSRFPVYEDSIDNVIGILISRDFLINRCQDQPKPFRELIRPAHFVPETVRTDLLFREMQTEKQHMAIVIDEYGGTSGLITLEDLLEEIVGNIYDEFDPKEEQDITPLPDGRWRVSGLVDLETLAEATGAELPLDEEYDTLGGMVFSQLTEIPSNDARPQVECFGLRVSVTQIADRRVEWAIVEKLAASVEEENESNSR